MAAYQEAFEKLYHKVDGLPEGFFIGCFIAGLKDEIRLDVKIKHLASLTKTIGVARLIEERNQLQRRMSRSYRASITTTNAWAVPDSASGLLGPPPFSRGTQPANSPIVRRL